MQRSVLHLSVNLLAAVLLMAGPGAVPAFSSEEPLADVARLFHATAAGLSDPADRAAMEQLLAVYTERARLADERTNVWMLLKFSRDGVLEDVGVNARALLSIPAVIQRAVILHELEHLKWARETRRLLARTPDAPRSSAFGPTQPQVVSDESAARRGAVGSAHRPVDASKLQHIVRVLVEDEVRAYRRDILYVAEVVQAHGGLEAYLVTLPPAHRQPFQRYYTEHVQRFLEPDGTVNEERLRRDFIFFETFPHRHLRYYEAALAWEALQGHITLRRGPDGILRAKDILAPRDFLTWLTP